MSERAALLVVALGRKQEIVQRARRDIRLKALLDLWLYVHVPLSFALLAALDRARGRGLLLLLNRRAPTAPSAMRCTIRYLSRQRTGRVAQTEQLVEAPGRELTLGRGTDSDVFLRDLRVNYHHARLTVRDHDLVIEAVGESVLRVDQKPVKRAVVTPNSEIEVGPYRVALQPGEADDDLTLTVELISPPPVDTVERCWRRAGCGSAAGCCASGRCPGSCSCWSCPAAWCCRSSPTARRRPASPAGSKPPTPGPGPAGGARGRALQGGQCGRRLGRRRPGGRRPRGARRRPPHRARSGPRGGAITCSPASTGSGSAASCRRRTSGCATTARPATRCPSRPCRARPAAPATPTSAIISTPRASSSRASTPAPARAVTSSTRGRPASSRRARACAPTATTTSSTRAPKTTLLDAADFGKAHPQFRPSVIIDPATRKVERGRIGTAELPKERSNLHFSHAVHLARTCPVAGVTDPERLKTVPAETPAGLHTCSQQARDRMDRPDGLECATATGRSRRGAHAAGAHAGPLRGLLTG